MFYSSFLFILLYVNNFLLSAQLSRMTMSHIDQTSNCKSWCVDIKLYVFYRSCIYSLTSMSPCVNSNGKILYKLDVSKLNRQYAIHQCNCTLCVFVCVCGCVCLWLKSMCWLHGAILMLSRTSINKGKMLIFGRFNSWSR